MGFLLLPNPPYLNLTETYLGLPVKFNPRENKGEDVVAEDLRQGAKLHQIMQRKENLKKGLGVKGKVGGYSICPSFVKCHCSQILSLILVACHAK